MQKQVAQDVHETVYLSLLAAVLQSIRFTLTFKYHVHWKRIRMPKKGNIYKHLITIVFKYFWKFLAS